MFRSLILIAALWPATVLAAGGDRESPPKPTETTTDCSDGQVWDSASNSCVDVKSERLDDETLYDAVREFAYAGQYLNAQAALAAMSDQTDDRVQTYWGFTHRKMGDVAKGMAYYESAIDHNPGNILARSYMGQALVEQGDLDGARQQLAAIRAQGGEGSWPEVSLLEAITTGTTSDY